MAKVDVIQTSFTAGEIGDQLLGRTDIAQYANACQIVENFMPRSYGPAISTPGTEYIRTASVSTSLVRLLRFVFNRTDAYAIEFGPEYFHFYTNGGIVITTGTTPFHLSHVFTETELFDVHYTQLNDIIWMAHPDHPPQKLVRSAAASWSIADAPIVGGPFLDENTTATTLTASATTGTVNITASTTGVFTVSNGTTKGHVDSYWSIGGLAQTNATTGLQETGYVQITDVIDTATATATVIKNLRVSTATVQWAEGAWSAVRGYPARVIFDKRRLWFARTAHEPQKQWGSKVFVYEDFSLNTQADDDGMNLALASNESNEIQWLASGRSLLSGTFGGGFVTNSGSTEPLTPNNATATEEIGYGSEAIAPKKIGGFIYFVQRFGKKLREMFYNFDTDNYKAVDKTILSPEILDSGVVDMDVAQNPESVLYCTLTSGTLATMTREIDQEVTGWARQTTNGTYSSVAIIPSQSDLYDEVWVVVTRWINGSEKRFIERFAPIEPPVRQDLMNYLHSSLLYNAYTADTSSTITISLSATTGSITVTSSGVAFAQAQVGMRLRAIDALGATLGEAKITATNSTTSISATTITNFDGLSYGTERWGVSVDSISGMDHLEAETVVVLADGGIDAPTKTVASGSVALGYNYFVVRCGLGYDQIIQTLPKEAGSVRGTSQAKKQRISEISFKLNRSYKGFQAGGTAAEVDQVGKRDPSTLMGSPESLFTGVYPNDEAGTGLTLRNDYKYGSVVYIKNSDPLPVELLAIIMNMETFDK